MAGCVGRVLPNSAGGFQPSCFSVKPNQIVEVGKSGRVEWESGGGEWRGGVGGGEWRGRVEGESGRGEGGEFHSAGARKLLRNVRNWGPGMTRCAA